MKKDDDKKSSLNDEDPHYFVMKGRRWRKSDPNIPASLYQQLVNELMSARRAVGSGKKAGDEDAIIKARARVQDAKVALGERGHKWWLDIDQEAMLERLKAAIRTLLRYRGFDKTICPSDAARICGADNWQSLMDDTKKVALELQQQGWLEITQKGKMVKPPFKGPIRLKQVKPDSI